MIIIVFKYIVPNGFTGITLYPFIFLKQKKLTKNKTLLNHEKIHLKQQLELLIIFFYLFYVLEWLFKFIRYKNSYIAYKNISFEKEAYINEANLYYLKKRKLWAFTSYL